MAFRIIELLEERCCRLAAYGGGIGGGSGGLCIASL